MAADHCTNPTEYTIDRRCYVTDKQKQQKPYNAVVEVLNLKWKKKGLHPFVVKACVKGVGLFLITATL